MVDKSTVKLLADLSLTMFRKNFFGIYHGAISAKVDQHNFIINTGDAIFDEMSENSFCTLNINKQDIIDNDGNNKEITINIKISNNLNLIFILFPTFLQHFKSNFM